MRKPEYPDEVIIAAGLAIQADGKTVNKYGLKALVKGGDPARLLAVWNEHEAKVKAAAQVVHDLPACMEKVLDSATTSIVDHLHKIATTLNRAAIESAEMRVAQIRLETDMVIAQARQEQLDADSLMQNLQDEIDDLLKQNESLSTTLKDSTEERQKEAIATSLQLHKLNELDLNAQAAQKQINVEKDRVEGLTMDRDAARRVEVELKTELRLKESRLIELENALDTLQKAEAMAKQALGQERGKSDALEIQVVTLAAEREDSRLAEIDLREQLTQAIGDSALLRAKLLEHSQPALDTLPQDRKSE